MAKKLKVLVAGGGGREHALAWKIAQSKRLGRLYCAPGNAGTKELARNVDISAEDFDGLVRFVKREDIDLTVVGPEAPLVAGLVDRLRAEGRAAFGPGKRAAELEGSKAFAKALMRRYGIPTADFQIFASADTAKAYVDEVGAPVVVKADGLAAGKGVIVCSTVEEAHAAIEAAMVEKRWGSAGDKVVIEEKLEGEEASILALVDGQTIAPLASSQDHKAVFDDDRGPNTGGMGAYSPAPVVTEETMDRIIREVLVPTVHGMRKEGRPYSGILYAGLMMASDGPKVLEFNVRFGDPETQPIVARLKSDLLGHIMAVVEGRLADEELLWDERSAVCVVMASGGYPGSYEKGKEIRGLDELKLVPDAVAFHAGTALKEGKVVTSGGRVLGVTGLGAGLR